MNLVADLNQARLSWLAAMAAHDLIEKGVRDGMEGLPMASEHVAYYDGWVRGSRAFQAGNRELVILFGPGSRCECCGAEAPGYHLTCPAECKNVQDASVLFGGMCLYGPVADGPEFISNPELRLMVIQGLTVVDSEGASMNAQILIQ